MDLLPLHPCSDTGGWIHPLPRSLDPWIFGVIQEGTSETTDTRRTFGMDPSPPPQERGEWRTDEEEDHGMGVWKNVRLWNAGLGPTKGEAKRLQEVGATVHRGKKLGPTTNTRNERGTDDGESTREEQFEKGTADETLQTIQEDKETKVDADTKPAHDTAVTQATGGDAVDSGKGSESKKSPNGKWKSFKTWMSRITMTKKDTRMLHSVGATVHRGREGRRMPSLSDKFEELRMTDKEASSPELQTLHNLEQRESVRMTRMPTLKERRQGASKWRSN
eukprot:scaffold287_cov337-Pavlova_lutheri.AAC.7